MMEGILVYWHPLAYILKEMVEKIRKKCFSYPWTRKGEREGIPFVALE
jgi:hypothetical protein